MSAFNQNPIIVTAAMTQSFWATLRTLGLMGAGQTKPIQVVAIKWLDPGPSASYSITDGVGNAILDQGDTQPDYIGGDVQNTWPPGAKRWRDFQVVILQGGALQIDYR